MSSFLKMSGLPRACYMMCPLSFLQYLAKMHQGGIKDVILKFYQSRHPKILVEKEMSRFNFFF